MKPYQCGWVVRGINPKNGLLSRYLVCLERITAVLGASEAERMGWKEVRFEEFYKWENQ